MLKLFAWDIYELTSTSTSVNGIMLRGRIRKFGLKNKRNILAENTEDIDNGVRFAIPAGEDASLIVAYLHSIIVDALIRKVKENVPNPVLSKLKVNDESRYTL